MTRHRRAVLLMAGAATLWSIAGVVTRHLTPGLAADARFEVAFWRSLVAAIAIGAFLLVVRSRTRTPLHAIGTAGLVSATMWATMFTAFMLALTYTTTANALLVMSVSPLLTALLARAVLGAPITPRTAIAIIAAAVGILWMFAQQSTSPMSAGHRIGMLIALAVPVASAINVVALKKAHAAIDLLPAILLGGALSAAVLAPFALPFRAGASDIALLALLGVFQLALPCAMMLAAVRDLSAPEIALLGLLEVVLGPLWAWLGAGETPAAATIYGGAVVLAALVFNELAPDHNRTSRAAH